MLRILAGRDEVQAATVIAHERIRFDDRAIDGLAATWAAIDANGDLRICRRQAL
jgi:hypothetical protein